ncbi:hypothetical protein [Ciceribacter selenitireducens]|uniref:hypothetical protein n=1 Tax=Ciceribacter selenitireducens TaxID=448181 RepID=UPI0004BC176A|nr:hypothetical protein [Ciceribacter selenitireducens]
MSKRRQSQRSRPKARVRADGSTANGQRPRPEAASSAAKGQAEAKTKATAKATATVGGKSTASAAAASARAAASDAPPVPAGNRPDFAAIFANPSFRRSLWLLNAGVIGLLLSQGIPHDYGFLELGALFTLSVYDLALAMLGLALGAAMAETRRDFAAVVGVFLAVLVVMLTFFDPIFRVILSSPLGEVLYLIAPTAVMLTGASLWLTGRYRQWAVMLAAAVVAFAFSLFVGLDDIGVGLIDFAFGTVLSALWLVLAPALMLRHFRGPWLRIPSRIVGSWLVVIGIIVLVSLYVPMPLKAPALPDPSQPDGGAIELQIPDDGSAPTLNGEVLDLEGAAEPQAPGAPSSPSEPSAPAEPAPAQTTPPKP